jgi:hypothetical protein
MYERYLTKEQLAKMDARRAELGEEAIKAAMAEWPQLIAKVAAAKTAGISPSDASVRPLAERWRELVKLAVADDPEIAVRVRTMIEKEPGVVQRPGFAANMPELMDYVQSILSAHGIKWF